MFDKMKALLDMQKKMQEVKRELENTIFEISSSDGILKISMNGSQEVQQASINCELNTVNKAVFEKAIKETYNRAIKHSHEVAAQKMKDITGFNLPGMV